MTRRLAKRIARTMIMQFGKKTFFVVSLSSRAALEQLARVFIEDHGCRVAWNEWSNRIAVRLPAKA